MAVINSPGIIQINDIHVTIPPTQIEVNVMYRNEKVDVLRSQSELYLRSGYGTVFFRFSLVFQDTKAVNEELIPLVIQSNKTPFFYISNEALRTELVPYLIPNMTETTDSVLYQLSIVGRLLNLKYSSHPQAPGVIVADFSFSLFNYRPFMKQWLYKTHWPTPDEVVNAVRTIENSFERPTKLVPSTSVQIGLGVNGSNPAGLTAFTRSPGSDLMANIEPYQRDKVQLIFRDNIKDTRKKLKEIIDDPKIYGNQTTNPVLSDWWKHYYMHKTYLQDEHTNEPLNHIDQIENKLTIHYKEFANLKEVGFTPRFEENSNTEVSRPDLDITKIDWRLPQFQDLLITAMENACKFKVEDPRPSTLTVDQSGHNIKPTGRPLIRELSKKWNTNGKQWINLVKKIFGSDPRLIPTFLFMIMHESSRPTDKGDRFLVNKKEAKSLGSEYNQAFGLLQVTEIHKKELAKAKIISSVENFYREILEPETNLKAALLVYKQAKNTLNPWQPKESVAIYMRHFDNEVKELLSSTKLVQKETVQKKTVQDFSNELFGDTNDINMTSDGIKISGNELSNNINNIEILYEDFYSTRDKALKRINEDYADSYDQGWRSVYEMMTNQEYLRERGNTSLRNIFYKDHSWEMPPSLVLESVGVSIDNNNLTIPIAGALLATSQHLTTPSARFDLGIHAVPEFEEGELILNQAQIELNNILKLVQEQNISYKYVNKKNSLAISNSILQVANVSQQGEEEGYNWDHVGRVPVVIDSINIISDQRSPNTFILNIVGAFNRTQFEEVEKIENFNLSVEELVSEICPLLIQDVTNIVKSRYKNETTPFDIFWDVAFWKAMSNKFKLPEKSKYSQFLPDISGDYTTTEEEAIQLMGSIFLYFFSLGPFKILEDLTSDTLVELDLYLGVGGLIATIGTGGIAAIIGLLLSIASMATSVHEYLQNFQTKEDLKSYMQFLDKGFIKYPIRDHKDFLVNLGLSSNLIDSRSEDPIMVEDALTHHKYDIIRYAIRNYSRITPKARVMLEAFSSRKQLGTKSCYPDMTLPPNPFLEELYRDSEFGDFFTEVMPPYFYLVGSGNQKSVIEKKIEEYLSDAAEVINDSEETQTKLKRIQGNTSLSLDPEMHASRLYEQDKEKKLTTKDVTLQLYSFENAKEWIKTLKEDLTNECYIKSSPQRMAPTYKVYFKERTSDKFYFNFFDEFFGVNAIRRISITSTRKFPASYAVIEILNTQGHLNNKVFWGADGARSDGGHVVESSLIRNMKNYNTSITNTLLKDGTDIQIRLGYASDPEDLETVFNGQIFSIEGEDVLTIKCYSYGYELASKEYNPYDGHEDDEDYDETSELLEWCLTRPEVMHFGRKELLDFVVPKGFGLNLRQRLLGGLQTDREGKISQTTFRFISYPQNDNVFVEEIRTKYSRWSPTTWFAMAVRDGSSLDLESSVLSIKFEAFKEWFKELVVPWSEEIFLGPYIPFKQTLWDIIQEMTLRHCGTIASVVPYDDYVTLFFGKPSLFYFYRSRDLYDYISNIEHNNLKERITGSLEKTKKQFRRYHYVDSMSHIVNNNIRADYSGTFTEITVLTATKRDDTASFNADYNDETDDTKDVINDPGDFDQIAPMRLNRNIVDNYIRGATMGFPNVRNQTIGERYASSLLALSAHELYKGTLTLIGNETIKPWDYMYLYDSYNDMYGAIQVRDVTHVISPETGFVTEIVPDMIAVTNDYVTTALKDAMLNVLNQIWLDSYMEEAKSWQTLSWVHAEPVVKSIEYATTATLAVKAGSWIRTGATKAGKWAEGKLLSQSRTNLLYGPARQAVGQHLNEVSEMIGKVAAKAPRLTKIAGTLGRIPIKHPVAMITAGVVMVVFAGALIDLGNEEKTAFPVVVSPLIKNGKPYVIGVNGYDMNTFHQHLSKKVQKFIKKYNLTEDLADELMSISVIGISNDTLTQVLETLGN